MFPSLPGLSGQSMDHPAKPGGDGGIFVRSTHVTTLLLEGRVAKLSAQRLSAAREGVFSAVTLLNPASPHPASPEAGGGAHLCLGRDTANTTSSPLPLLQGEAGWGFLTELQS